MVDSRIRSTIVFAGLACSGLALIASTQPWFAATITDGQVLSIAGDAAAPALATLSLAGLALFAALTIAGPVFRAILATLAIAIGGVIAGSGIGALADPIPAVASSVSAATGVAGASSVAALVDGVDVTAWVFLAVVAGVGLAIDGIAIVLATGAWPKASRKFSAPWQSAGADPDPAPTTSPTAVDAWDSLSLGEDPTRERPVE
jgi:hypothetical protein